MPLPDRRDEVPLTGQFIIADDGRPIVQGEMMQASPEFPVSVLQPRCSLHVQAADGGQRGNLAYVVTEAKYRRVFAGIAENQVLHDELDVADTPAAVLEIEPTGLAAIEFLAHARAHGNDVVS